MSRNVAASLRVLLDDLVDYAGLFPPASLDMKAAVRSYASHQVSEHADALGRFVVPAGRLDELAGAISAHATAHGDADLGLPWRLSVLTGNDPEGALAKVEAFTQTHGDLGQVTAIEARATNEDEVARTAACFPEAERFIEIAHDRDPAPLMRALAATGSRAKIRTGGVTQDAFPASSEIVRFLVAAHEAGVALKFTAGLHHPLCGTFPLTYDEDSDRGQMFGFVGMFLTAAWVRSGMRDPARLTALLEANDPGAFLFHDDGARWRDVCFSATDLESTRASFARSYGSCSFDEPTSELESLGFL